MSQGAGELYVYYKLRAGLAAAARAAFDAARGMAPVRLLQRDEGGAWLTWMEIYAPEQPELEARIAAALAPFIEGERHGERFAELKPGRP
ncbi:DUF4936 family protein [Roseateles violae]|uniref:DUF4936 family protein n=1 Tax=Roseateles violae TaxID=3058042 RepID=A0ABT8DQL3_9BURK|nr:DUF4936 family protein [Pelomonas sp. PFR6]MDN3920630.1 DUF4936 family protein [Pelomonas sp. PFR6]